MRSHEIKFITSFPCRFRRDETECLADSGTCFSPFEALTFYISSSDPADDETCTDNGTLLRPCYSLQQLSNGNTLLSGRNSVTLLLLPGKHAISQTFTAYNVGKLNIHPWNNQQVTIVCRLPKQLIFYNVREMVIFSFNFTSCTLQYIQTYYSTQVDQIIVLFDNCVFTANPLNYTLMITNTVRLRLNVSINNCTFSLNGAVLIKSSFSCSSLRITDSEFFHNQRKGFGSTLFAHGDMIVSISIIISKSVH